MRVGYPYVIFSDPEALLLAGILFRILRGIRSETSKTSNKTSTTHIMAISGFNVLDVAGPTQLGILLTVV